MDYPLILWCFPRFEVFWPQVALARPDLYIEGLRRMRFNASILIAWMLRPTNLQKEKRETWWKRVETCGNMVIKNGAKKRLKMVKINRKRSKTIEKHEERWENGRNIHERRLLLRLLRPVSRVRVRAQCSLSRRPGLDGAQSHGGLDGHRDGGQRVLVRLLRVLHPLRGAWAAPFEPLNALYNDNNNKAFKRLSTPLKEALRAFKGL